MPLGLEQPFNDTPDDLTDAAATLPLPQSEHSAQALDFGDFSRKLGHWAMAPMGEDPTEETHADYLDRVGMLDPETANEKYGVAGALRFNQPTTDYDAAWASAQAQRAQFRDDVFARTKPQPLTDLGLGLAGSLLDPAALGVMALTGGAGDLALEGGAVAARGLGLMGAEDAAPAVSTLGRLANAARVPITGALDNIPFVAINAGLTNYGGDDYDMGDALRDIAAGAVLHTGTHLAFRTLPGLFRRGGAAVDPDAPANPDMMDQPTPGPAMEPNPAPAAGVPDAVDALPETARRGAFVKAVDDLTDDRPVDVGQYVKTELDSRIAATADAGPVAVDPATFDPVQALHNPDYMPGYWPPEGVNGPTAAPYFNAVVDEISARTDGRTLGNENVLDTYLREGPEAGRAALDEHYPALPQDTPGRIAAINAIAGGAAPGGAYLDTLRQMRSGNPSRAKVRELSAQAGKLVEGRTPKDREIARALATKIIDQEHDVAHGISAQTNARFAADDAGDLDKLRPPGRTVVEDAPDHPIREPADVAGAGRPDGGSAAKGDGDTGGVAAAKPPNVDALIAGDPELKALRDDTAAQLAARGLSEPETPPNQDPGALAQAVQAAASCMADAAEEVL